MAFVSFRLGGGDGVSVEAAKWIWAFGELGFDTTTVAGEGAEVVLPGLAIDAEEPPAKEEIEDALSAADLVVVENLCSLPLNPRAATVVAEVLHNRPALLHHHDLPWQRERFAGFPPPPDHPSWVHVTINQLSRRQLARHRIHAHVVRNTFDTEVAPGDRARARAEVGVGEEELLVLQPTRAIARKNIAAAVTLAEQLGATYWLPGPAEDGFGPELERVVSKARCPVVLGHAPGADDARMSDAYAASDIVALPSTWEGFGNPAVESAVHLRPLAIGHYPVAAELASFGFRWFAADDIGRLRRWVREPDNSLLEHNVSVARTHFSLRSLPGRIAQVLEESGW